MRYPNLRYGNPEEFNYYAAGRDAASLANELRRDERTVRDWMTGRTRVPWWVPEILRLRRMEHDEWRRQVGFERLAPQLGIVKADVLEFPRRPEKKKPQITDLRLDDFDQAVG
jgi:hypothetical protein